jgi:hydroxymethylglutaryl-CoA synthase
MTGIVGYSAYLPSYRIQRDTVAAAWDSRSAGGQKICARFDEDSLTMAATASSDCLASIGAEQRLACTSLTFASTTAPYLERANSAIIAAVCDLPASVLIADHAASLRAGCSALAAAFDLVAARGGTALVCAADTREAEPGFPEEQLFSDAAAAIAIGDSAVIAELVASASSYDDFFDTTRRDRDAAVNSFDSKFSTERGYIAPLKSTMQSVLSDAGCSAKDVARLVIPALDKRSHLQLAKSIGVSESHIQDIFWDAIGLTGCAAPLLQLIAALEQAAPGELILTGGYGNGANAFLFRTTELISEYKPRVSFAAQRGAGICYPSYTLYRKAREYRHSHDDGLEITNVFYTKEEAQNMRLHGSECRSCGQRHFPMTKVCARCEHHDLTEVALERSGKVFTFAVDNLAASPFPPVVMAVVDLDGGGRIYCELVDAPPYQVRIGAPVELVLRRLREGGGLHHYYWKCRPRRW